MKKMRLWNVGRYEDGAGMLIRESEVGQAVCTLDNTIMVVRGVDVDQIDKLNEKLEESETNRLDYYELEQFLKENGFEGAEVESADDYMYPDDVVIYVQDERMFMNLNDCLFVDVYKWWDGRNWKIETYDPEFDKIEYRLTISENFVNLDEWDGRNHTTGGMGNHARIYRVFELDGEKVEDTFLLNEWSQWQGCHETGRIVTLDELPDVLRELDRDPDEYMNEIVGIKE